MAAITPAGSSPNVNTGAAFAPDADKLLLKAAQDGTLTQEMLKDFIADGANINANDKDYTTPLMLAANGGHEEAVNALLESGADVNAWNDDFYSALHFAAQIGHEGIVSALLEKGARVTMMDNPIWVAVYSRNERVVRMLLEKGAQCTPSALQLAAAQGYKEILIALLEKNPFLDQADSSNYTPLIKASENGHEECVRILLAAGARVDPGHLVGGHTALMKAAKAGHLKVVEVLIAAGADVNAVNRFNERTTALIEAAANRHREIATALIAAGANVNAQDQSGCTPLFLAIRHCNLEMVSELLFANADLNLNPRNRTTLGMAAAKVNDEPTNIEAAKIVLLCHLIPKLRQEGWQPEMHELFPQAFKDAVEALLLARHKGTEENQPIGTLPDNVAALALPGQLAVQMGYCDVNRYPQENQN